MGEVGKGREVHSSFQLLLERRKYFVIEFCSIALVEFIM